MRIPAFVILGLWAGSLFGEPAFAVQANVVRDTTVLAPGIDYEVAPTKKSGWKPEGLAKLEAYAFSSTEKHRTNAVVILHRGNLVYEKYANGYSKDMRHAGWSITKSIATALLGIAESEGKISRQDLVTKFFPEMKGSVWSDVTLLNLANMDSGIAWDETYEAGPLRSNVVSMLYRTSYSADMGGYRLHQKKRVAPIGKRYNYSSGDTNLMMKALNVVIGQAEYDDYPWKALFDPIDAKSFVIQQDPAGTFVGSSYAFATPRDFARFGQLFLNEGKWGNRQVIPAEWVKYSRTPGPPFSDLRLDHSPNEPYGAGWWLNAAIPTAQIGKQIASAPNDMYWAAGHHGQYIFVIPSWDLVVVRLGLDRGNRIDGNQFFKLLQEAMP